MTRKDAQIQRRTGRAVGARGNDPNWQFDGEFVRNDDALHDDGLDACRGILFGFLLGAVVWGAGLLIWWWL